jgi:hypothetical protein
METLDWTKLSKEMLENKGKVQYEPNKGLFTKLAFDVFQLNTTHVESLWTLESGDDGKQYLVAMYSDDDTAGSIEAKGSWAALADADNKNITVFYKDTPIQRFASSDYNFDQNDAYIFQKTLAEKLNSDKSFVDKFVKSQPQEKQDLLLGQFPELA